MSFAENWATALCKRTRLQSAWHQQRGVVMCLATNPLGNAKFWPSDGAFENYAEWALCRIGNDKRPLRIAKRCVLHDCWEIPFPQSWFRSTPKRPDFQLRRAANSKRSTCIVAKP